MLALVYANSMLHCPLLTETSTEAEKKHWEEVENRQKIIRAMDFEPVKERVMQLLVLEKFEAPPEVQTKFFQFANAMLDTIIGMNSL